MLRRLPLHQPLQSAKQLISVSFFAARPIGSQRETASTQKQQKPQDADFRFKFRHLDGKYKRLHNVSPTNKKPMRSMQNATNSQRANDGEVEEEEEAFENAKPLNDQNQNITFEKEVEALKNLARTDSQELQNRQNATSGLAVAKMNQTQRNQNNAAKIKNKVKETKEESEKNGNRDVENEKQQQQQQETDASEANRGDAGAFRHKDDDIIISREVSDAIGFFPKSQLLLLPNTSGRFKDDERKLTIKHSCLRDAKNQIFPNSNKQQQEEGSQRVMIFGQDTSALAIKCSKAIEQINQNNNISSASPPLLIVVDKQLEKLLQMSQQLQQHQHPKEASSPSPAPPSSYFFIRSVDPYFALLHCVPDRSLRRLVVSFPPPCPSDSESHRRVVTNHFLALVHQKLELGGDVVVTTDLLQLHRFHREQLLITEGKMSWAEPVSPASEGSDDPDASSNSQGDEAVGDDKKRRTLTQLRAAIEEKNKKKNQSMKSRLDNINNNKNNDNSVDATDDELLDLGSMPTLEEAPPRIKFALMQKQQLMLGQGVDAFYTMRRFKDMETPDHVILQNSRHVSDRRLRYGALTR